MKDCYKEFTESEEASILWLLQITGFMHSYPVCWSNTLESYFTDSFNKWANYHEYLT